MKSLKFLLTRALAYAAITLSLSMCGQAQTLTFLTQFTGTQTHATSVIQAADGNFYGATEGNNSQSYGTIFRMTPTGEISTIYTFCSQPNCADGEQPYVGPILGNDGNLYGVLHAGGNATDSGTFYRMTLDGQLTTLYTFCSLQNCADGQVPNGVIQGWDGNFYGTTELGGASNQGILFRISMTGAFKVLHTFCSQTNCAEGRGANVIQGADGNFYGTGGGGTLGGGVFYQMTPGGTFNVLYNFCFYTDVNCTTGSYPNAIVQDAEGDFLGTAEFGGDNNWGTVFKITVKDHKYHVLHWFDANHGNDPLFALTLANDGNLYGVATDSGVGDYAGTIFEVPRKGGYTALYTFDSSSEPYDPFDRLFQGTDGLFYGATLYGAGNCCYGTIFSLDNGLRPMVETVPTGGRVGRSVIILGNGLTGSTSVTFNGVPAEFTVEKDTFITATVPAGATTGTVSVVTPSGTLNSNPQFVVTK